MVQKYLGALILVVVIAVAVVVAVAARADVHNPSPWRAGSVGEKIGFLKDPEVQRFLQTALRTDGQRATLRLG